MIRHGRERRRGGPWHPARVDTLLTGASGFVGSHVAIAFAVAPYRGVLPAVAIASMKEQLSGACTIEIAAFDEFSKLLGDPALTAGTDHVIFDTVPTGHSPGDTEQPLIASSTRTETVTLAVP